MAPVLAGTPGQLFYPPCPSLDCLSLRVRVVYAGLCDLGRSNMVALAACCIVSSTHASLNLFGVRRLFFSFLFVLLTGTGKRDSPGGEADRENYPPTHTTGRSIWYWPQVGACEGSPDWCVGKR